jgi:hypothetical protein
MQDDEELHSGGVEELGAELEASLRCCHHMVADYRVMLIAVGDMRLPDEEAWPA